MDRGAQYRRTRGAIKDERKAAVARAALRLFLERGIESVRMSDAADAAGVGVASVYRYYPTKIDLAVAAAELFWEEELNAYYERRLAEPSAEAGSRAAVERCLSFYRDLLADRSPYIRFVERFDAFVAREGVPPDRLERYGSLIARSSALLRDLIAAGQAAGEFRTELDVDSYVRTVGLALMGLCRKHASSSVLIPADRGRSGDADLASLIDICVRYLSP